MYVCSCRAVTDRTVKSVISNGARTIDQIADRCGAGSLCQGCWPTLSKLLAEAERRPSRGKGSSRGTTLLGT
ncbi:MAG: (2Fe-2S)-binding protein [Actinobacteria bacterium]|nr:(2Fe-2S)-binding protein [Actinomycetota bacterium]